MNKTVIKSLALPGCEDIRYALLKEGEHSHIHTSGHKVSNGNDYVELRNICFRADKDYIIDAPEYDELKSGLWYIENYEPRIMYQIENLVNILSANPDSRHGILSFYDVDKDQLSDDMICTMYVSCRLRPMPDAYILDYTVHMRSSDVREYRSDVKFHKKARHSLALELQKKMQCSIIEGSIIWYADSLQCWDKDWELLKT